MVGGHLSLMGKAHGRAVTRWWKGAGPVRVKSRSQTNATHQRTHMASKTMGRRPKSPGNVDGDAHMQGERIERRKWERRDIRTGTANPEHSNTEAPKTPDAEATPRVLGSA